MENYVCIHGHFYQPPRENPWLESVEVQDAAYPYHDWNERITAECYESNATSRILDEAGKIVRIVNNYSSISFNFGPTLLAWLEHNAPDVYRAVLEADRESRVTFSGHGSALAQAYNHLILPLANHRDKYTQVYWGIQDFRRRFGREPKGMWLPETAVDVETLEVLAELGIEFTILAPQQAAAIRRLQSKEWQDVSGGQVDTSMAYLLQLPSGRDISVFFYNEVVARGVAFEGLLSNGDRFAKRLTESLAGADDGPHLAHIATDGESYGHHHRFGDMALAAALDAIESKGLARITNYSEFLATHPPAYEVRIGENSSWSCIHGVERWRSDCGCNSGAHQGWNQAWRGPLREALDWLRDHIASLYEERASGLLKDPWKARNEYIDVVLDRSPENLHHFIERHGARQLRPDEMLTAVKLLEMQRHAMLMYTSCGWFFDDISGIETVQVIQYAGRAIQLAQQVIGGDIEGPFLELLEGAVSNVPDHRNGRHIYEKWVKPTVIDLSTVTAHYAISSLFEEYAEEETIGAYSMEKLEYKVSDGGRARLAVGKVRATSIVTQESDVLSFGVLHFGDHNITAGVRRFRREDAYRTMVQEVTAPFESADVPSVIRALDKHFGAATYSIRSLFRDGQRKVTDYILESTLAETEALYRQVYDTNYSLCRFLTELGRPLPRVFQAAAEFIIGADLDRALSNGPATIDQEAITGLLADAGRFNICLDSEGLGYLLGHVLEHKMDSFASSPDNLSSLIELNEVATMVHSLPFEVDLRQAQNVFYQVLQSTYPDYAAQSEGGNEDARAWRDLFVSLGDSLAVRVQYRASVP